MAPAQAFWQYCINCYSQYEPVHTVQLHTDNIPYTSCTTSSLMTNTLACPVTDSAQVSGCSAAYQNTISDSIQAASGQVDGVDTLYV